MSETRQFPEWMGKMRGLTPEELSEFLAGPVVARIATVDEEGFPYVTPVWQEWDGEAMYIIPREKTVFVKHILKNPKVAISCAMDAVSSPASASRALCVTSAPRLATRPGWPWRA